MKDPNPPDARPALIGAFLLGLDSLQGRSVPFGPSDQRRWCGEMLTVIDNCLLFAT